MSQAGVLNIEDANLPSDVPIDFQGNTGPGASAVNHLIYILGSGGVNVDTTGQDITITVSGSGFTWNTITSSDNIKQLLVENGYVTKGASPCIMLLPPAANVGDTIQILGYGNLWQITQNAGQTIFLGVRQTTAGVLGSLSATMIKDKITLTCVTANLEWDVTSSIGNITVV